MKQKKLIYSTATAVVCGNMEVVEGGSIGLKIEDAGPGSRSWAKAKLMT